MSCTPLIIDILLRLYYETRYTSHSTHWNYQKVKKHILLCLFFIRHQTVTIKYTMVSITHTIRTLKLLDHCLSFCPFSFRYYVVCPSTYGFGIFKLFYVYWWRVCEINFSYPFWHFHISFMKQDIHPIRHTGPIKKLRNLYFYLCFIFVTRQSPSSIQWSA
jgi:hypothetical protein